jgi:predicted permease
MAQTYQRDAQHATAITLFTTLLCMFTLPLLSILFGIFF